MSSASPIRIGIAGLGRSGYKLHAKGLTRAGLGEKFQLVAVADEILDRREEAAQEFGVRSFADYRELIADDQIDLFVCALPNKLHVEACIRALEAGLHVICEKPVAPSPSELDEIAHIAESRGKHFLPFQNYRFQPYFEKLQDVVSSGVLGEILHIKSYWGNFRRRWDWQILRSNIGGILYNSGPHAIDQALALAGWQHDWQVLCRLACHNAAGGDADDHCSLTLYPGSASGPTIDILLSDYQAYKPKEKYYIYGTRGGLAGSEFDLKWRFYRPEDAPGVSMWPGWSIDRQYCREELPWVEESWTMARPEDSDLAGRTMEFIISYGVQRFYSAAFETIRCGARAAVTVPQVRQQLAIIEEGHRQNRLPVKPDELANRR